MASEQNNPTLAQYLQDLSRHPPLSREEEQAVLKRVEKGDRRAADLLITSNLRFVVSVASEYEGRGLPMPDLIAEGNVGLLRAAEKFDPSRGYKFITYAVWWIRQRIRSAVMEHRTVRTPANRVDDLGQLSERTRELSHRLGRFPVTHEVASDLNLPRKRVERAMASAWQVNSLDQPLSDEGKEESFLDRLADDVDTSEDVEIGQRREIMAEALAGLKERERRIIRTSYGFDQEEPKNLRQISEEMGISRERVRQLRVRGLRQLRKHFRKTVLEDGSGWQEAL